ncbi:MAG: DUF4435 domain-containing protein [Ruminiclostridium sp.]|nr:DUF4435 domain-containing protein [Ruminiclostridium sp.]
MQYDLDETVLAAVMSGEPTVLVEGIDDIKFYGNVAHKIGRNINVQAIETVEGYSEGCDEIIRAIGDIQHSIQSDARLKKYILGIIDRDARYYRGELPNLECLFVLKYYSYESHLITTNTIKKQIEMLTKVTSSMIKDNVISYINEKFNEKLEKAYYISLEALKNACDTSYQACVAYSKKAGNIFSKSALEYIWGQVSYKKEELDEFANNYGVSRTDIKYLMKGKWWLYLWCEFIVNESKNLHFHCGNDFEICQMCKADKKEKCLWKVEGNFQIGQIKSFLCSIDAIDLNELDYLRQRLMLLAG